jgi:hypothetical protein
MNEMIRTYDLTQYPMSALHLSKDCQNLAFELSIAFAQSSQYKSFLPQKEEFLVCHTLRLFFSSSFLPKLFE